MSGQYPHSSTPTSQQHQFIRQHGPPHHLPPAPAGQYHPQAATQRPHWRHPAHNIGAGGIVYGSPHLSSYNIPGRSQPWPKPNESHYTLPASGANPLYNLPMQLTQNVIPSVLSESRPSGNYNQEETIDLSSHSLIVDRREKDVLRNGAMLETSVKVNENFSKTDSTMNGENFKSAINTENKDAVSVIAQNPLNDVLKCSKPDKDYGIKIGESALTKSIDALVRNATLVSKNQEPEAGNTAEYLGIRSPELNKSESSEVSTSLMYSEISPVKSFDCVNKLEYLSTKIIETENAAKINVEDLETSFKINESDQSETLVQTEENPNSEGSMSILEDDKHLESSNVNDNENVSLKIENVEKSNEIPQSNTIPSSFINSNNIVAIKPIYIPELPTDAVSSNEDHINLENELSHVKGSKASITEDQSLENNCIIKYETQSIDLQKSEENVNKKMSDDWESSNHTAENVESILENMFNAQDDKTSETASQSVIVSNEIKTSLLDDLRTDKSAIIIPMKEEELAQTLLEEPKDIKLDMKDKSLENIMNELHSESEKVDKKSKDEPVQFEEPMEVEEMKENIPEVVVNQANALKLVSKESVEEKPLVTPVESNTNSETEKNPFIEVESELEKMFAGIVEPASESNEVKAGADIKKPPTPKRTVVRRKAPNRRLSDNNVFGSEGKKKLTKRSSDIDGKKSKKSKLESGWDSPSGKKNKGVHKDISSDIGINKKGPFIHVEGSKENPTSVVVVNSGVRPEDEEGTEKAISRRKHSNYQRSEGKAARQRGTGLYSSTLSSRYDAQTADATWICVFCKRGPHCEGGLGGQPAGDLFGPYRISSSPPDDMIVSPSDRDVAEEQKRRGGGKQQSLRASGGVDHFIQKIAKKNKRLSLDDPESCVGMTLIPGEAKDVGYEVWTHEQCATWAPGVYIVGSKLVGIEEAVWAAVKTKCNQCGDTGAGLGCVVRNCVPRVHFGCALLCSWHLDQDTFIAKCNHHRKSYYSTGMLRPS